MAINRQQVYDKYNGRCAYSGTPLEDDWQVDHMYSKNYLHFFKKDNDADSIENLLPCQRKINNYKACFTAEQFKKHRINVLHKRLAKLPKNPKSEHLIKYKASILKIASYFGITPDKPFSGKFYFETFKPCPKCGKQLSEEEL